jgi:hypothetical protein
LLPALSRPGHDLPLISDPDRTSEGLDHSETCQPIYCSFSASVANRNARATIPPPDGPEPWGDDHPRDAILKGIDAKGSAGWKNDSSYQRRSLAENIIYRLKQLGESLYSRTFERQVTQAHVRAAIINTFTFLCMSQSVAVGQIAPAA